MAQSTTAHQIRPANKIGFVAKERCNTTNGLGSIAMSTDSLVNPGNFTDSDALDAALTAIDGTAYSALNLLSMTINDKIYALRVVGAGTETGAIL